MERLSTLSTKSKVFIASDRKKSKESTSVIKAAQIISWIEENPMVISKRNQNNYNQELRKMEIKGIEEECESECSFQSSSTNRSSRWYDSQDNSSERSDNSCNSRSNEVDFCSDLYNNIDQKHPIRIQKSHVHTSDSETSAKNKDEKFYSNEISSVDTSSSVHKKTRRGGKKNKAQKLKYEEKSISDKESEKYKTELCKNWIEKGKWRYSVRCRFAHGPHELVQAHIESEAEDYKLKHWLAFHENSYCPYGVRWHFIHENRRICDFTYSYYSKNLLLNEETRSTLPIKRLRVFEYLSCCVE